MTRPKIDLFDLARSENIFSRSSGDSEGFIEEEYARLVSAVEQMDDAIASTPFGTGGKEALLALVRVAAQVERVAVSLGVDQHIYAGHKGSAGIEILTLAMSAAMREDVRESQIKEEVSSMTNEEKAIMKAVDLGHDLAPPVVASEGILLIYGCNKCTKIFEVWKDTDIAVGPVLKGPCKEIKK